MTCGDGPSCGDGPICGDDRTGRPDVYRPEGGPAWPQYRMSASAGCRKGVHGRSTRKRHECRKATSEISSSCRSVVPCGVGCWFEDGRLESMTTACVYHRDRKRQTHPRRPGMSVVAGGGSSSAVRSTPVPAYRRPTTPYRLTPYRDPPVAVYRGAGVYGIIWVMTGLGGLNATMLNGASARWRAGVTRSRRRPEACGLLERALR